jgi:hypothetical protein
MRGKQLIHARTELIVTLAQSGNLIECDPRAPLQPLADRGLEMFEVSLVQDGRLPRLDG